MSISKDDHLANIIDDILLSLALAESVAIIEKNIDLKTIFENYTSEDLLVGTAMLAATIIRRESKRSDLTYAEYVQELREWLTQIQSSLN